MNILKRACCCVLRHCWLWTVVFIVATAIVLTAARILLPQADRYREQIESEVSQLIGQPLVIADFEFGWHGLGPRLYLKGVEIAPEADGPPLFSFRQAHVDIDLWSSLRSGELDFGVFTLTGLDLSLVRREDGRVALEGLDGGAPAEEEGAVPKIDTDAALAWLWRQGRLAVEQSRVRLRDLGDGGRLYLFDEISLLLVNEGRHARLSGRLRLPEQLGGELLLALEVERRGDDPRQWEIDLYTATEGVELPPLLSALDLPLEGRAGQGSARFWGRWREGAVADLRGHLELTGVALERRWQAQGDPASIERALVRGQFVWRRDGDGWRLDVDHLKLGRLGPESRLQLAFDPESGYQGAADRLDIALAAPLAALVPTLGQAQWQRIEALAPEGRIGALQFTWKPASDTAPTHFSARGEFSDLGVAALQRQPGFSGLDGHFELERERGTLTFATEAATFDSAGLFRHPIDLASLDGRVVWQRGEEGIHIELRRLMVANDDLAGEFDGRLFLPAGQAPQIALVGQIDYADVSRAGHYLPVRIMSEKTVAWLDRALVSGFVTNAGVLLHGPLDRFPFRHGEGRFEVRANVVDAIVDYAPGWPRLERVEAELIFSGPSMEVRGHRAEMLASELSRVRIAIADMKRKPLVVEIAGRARGGAEDVVAFLDEAPPLKARFGHILEGARARGASDLTLALKLPLGEGAELEVAGETRLEDASLDLRRFGVDIDAIDGTIAFGSDGLRARGVAATVMGQPARVDIRTGGDGAYQIFEARGISRFFALEKRLPSIPVFGYLHGQSDWQAILTLARGKPDEPARLALKSELIGTEVLLPEPVGKGADERRPLHVEAELGGEANLWRFEYDGRRLTGHFRQPHEGALRGELRFEGEAVLPERDGLRVAGHLARFEQQAWWPVLFPEESGEAEEGPPLLNQLDLTIDEVHLFGQHLKSVTLGSQLQGEVWETRVESDRLRGRLFVPQDWSLPLEARLDYLHLPRVDEEGEATGEAPLESFDPATLPPLRIRSERFDYGGHDLGQLELTTERRPSGLLLERLHLVAPFATIDARGAWNYISGQHASRLEATVEASDFGRLLDGLGYGGMIGEGRGRVVLDLRWGGPLLDLEPILLDGSITLDLRKGRILEVEPGAGRIFSLLSPRRLLLDFRDMEKGLAFDKMRGRFEIHSGNAFTRDFMLDGPVAKVEATGRIGLGARDYDQELKVTPHVTSSLPLLGAVVQGSLGAGAVVLLAERLLKPVIDKATTVRYTVTGSWESPVVTPLDLDRQADEEEGVLPEVLRDD